MKSQILKMLRESDHYVSGQELCEKFGVSRTAIWKAINSLKATGYEIEATPNKGYYLKEAADVMNSNELQSIRKTKWIGKEIHYFDKIDSTNTKAKELAEQGSGKRKTRKKLGITGRKWNFYDNPFKAGDQSQSCIHAHTGYSISSCKSPR